MHLFALECIKFVESTHSPPQIDKSTDYSWGITQTFSANANFLSIRNNYGTELWSLHAVDIIINVKNGLQIKMLVIASVCAKGQAL